MICPECGSVNTVKEYRDMPYTYKGQTIIVKAVALIGVSTLGRVLFSLRSQFVLIASWEILTNR